MDRETRDSLDKAVELEMKCGCDDSPTFDADTEGWRKAKAHQDNHSPKGASIRFIYPD